jgi:mRNA-degrading endonuclease RelE of RelBE toxin-antitoxin system
MPYRAKLSPDAFDEYNRLPPDLQDQVYDRLELICADPHRVGRPSIPPDEPPGYRAVRFFSKPCELDGAMYYFVILFEVDEEEELVLIYALGRKECDPF